MTPPLLEEIEYRLLSRYRVPGLLNRHDGLWIWFRRRDFIRPRRKATR